MLYLTFFAGKDLLLAMKRSLEDFGFESHDPNRPSPISAFLERIVARIERAEAVWEWLPEWRVLRELITKTDFSA